MPVIHVQPNDHNYLQSIASLFNSTPKIVTVTGAGISTNAGIPDFRSGNGIYSLRRRHLFYSSVLSDPERRPLFYENMTKMSRMASRASPTRTHEFIRKLCDTGKLVRDYTQNIDCLEEKVGLSINRHPICLEDARGVDCILLHGSLRQLRCFFCSKIYRWDDDGREEKTLSGREPLCPGCAEASDARVASGKRATAVGTLRPDIVLYDEQDLRAESINAIIQNDLSQHPDVLLIMGMSLTTDGVKFLVKDFATVVHKHGGTVVFVNLTEPAKVWNDIVDYWVEWDCDTWVQDLTSRQPVLCNESSEESRTYDRIPPSASHARNLGGRGY